jgi:hypothetical protein
MDWRSVRRTRRWTKDEPDVRNAQRGASRAGMTWVAGWCLVVASISACAPASKPLRLGPEWRDPGRSPGRVVIGVGDLSTCWSGTERCRRACHAKRQARIPPFLDDVAAEARGWPRAQPQEGLKQFIVTPG